MNIPVHRIIPFSNVEGIGNRTSIFVQGCNINCLYCHNSETIPKKYTDGQLYSTEKLLGIIQESVPFIRGITVSGGEPTLYHQGLTELFTKVHEEGLTCYIDTNGFFDRHQLEALIEVTDKFLFDVKAVGQSLDGLCFSDFQLESQVNENYDQRFTKSNEHLENLAYLLSVGKIEEVRHVCTRGFNDPKEVIDAIIELIKPYPEVTLKLIRVHLRGLPKERLLKLKGSVPSAIEVEALGDYAREQGVANVMTIL